MINQELLAGGNVLVHCVMGVSRSTTLILAFLVKYRKLTLSQSYYHVFDRRKCVNPNCGFWRQLINYELKIMQVKYERVRNKIWKKITEKNENIGNNLHGLKNIFFETRFEFVIFHQKYKKIYVQYFWRMLERF